MPGHPWCMLWNNHFPVHSLNVNTKERAQTVPHHIPIQIAERSKQQFKSNLLMSLGNRGTLPWTTGSHQYSQMQIQGTKLLYARLLCFVAEVSQQFRANASAPGLPTRKIFEAGDNTGTAEGRQQDTIVSICLDMNRAKQSGYPVRISPSYTHGLAGVPVRLKYAQISRQKIVKQLQLPVLCQKMFGNHSRNACGL